MYVQQCKINTTLFYHKFGAIPPVTDSTRLSSFPFPFPPPSFRVTLQDAQLASLLHIHVSLDKPSCTMPTSPSQSPTTPKATRRSPFDLISRLSSTRASQTTSTPTSSKSATPRAPKPLRRDSTPTTSANGLQTVVSTREGAAQDVGHEEKGDKNRIKSINPQISQTIRAAHCILDPSSIIKELIENALDAGSSRIDVRIRGKGGLDSIVVSDNGNGVHERNHETLCLPNTTSKIHGGDDFVSNLRTFGFRGEALSAICKLCQSVTVLTRHRADTRAFCLNYDKNGRFVSKSLGARMKGTTVSLSNVFCTLPVRRKDCILNSNRELTKCIAIVQSLAIISVHTRIELKINSDLKVCTTSNNNNSNNNNGKRNDFLNDLKLSIKSILGTKIISTLQSIQNDELANIIIPLSFRQQDAEANIRIHYKCIGYVSKATLNADGSGGRAKSNHQYSFINERPVDLPKVIRVMNDVYRKATGFTSACPTVIVNFVLPPWACDVNLAPDKRHVLIHEEDLFIEGVVKMMENLWMPTTKTNIPLQLQQKQQTKFASIGKTGALSNIKHGDDNDGEGKSKSKVGVTLSYTSPIPCSTSPLGGERMDMDNDPMNLFDMDKEYSREIERKDNVMEQREITKASKSSKCQDSGDEQQTTKHNNKLNENEMTNMIETTSKQLDFQSQETNNSIPEARQEEEKTQSVPAPQSPPPDDSDNDDMNAKPMPPLSSTAATPTKPISSWKSIMPSSTSASASQSSTPANKLDNLKRMSGLKRRRPINSNSGGGIFSYSEDEIRNKDWSKLGHQDVLKMTMKQRDLSTRQSISEYTGRRAAIAKRKLSTHSQQLSTLKQQFLKGGRGTPCTNDDGECDGINGTCDCHSNSRAALGMNAFPQTQTQAPISEKNDDETVVKSRLKLQKQAQARIRHHELPPTSMTDDEKDEQKLNQPVDIVMDGAVDEDNLIPSSGHTRMSQSCSDRTILKVDWDELLKEDGNTNTDMDVKEEALTQCEETFNKASLTESEGTELEAAYDELTRLFKQEWFKRLEIIGQFNRGFIIAKLGRNELFIIDQHASDEKYNFEYLQQHTILSCQRLVSPLSLEYSAEDELLIFQHLNALKLGGYEIKYDKTKIPTQRLTLHTQPTSKHIVFGENDLKDIIYMLKNNIYNKNNVTILRPPRIRSMFASRACRKSVMIGMALHKNQMGKILNNLSTIQHPWTCPHGRPTMRHLCTL